MSTDGVDRGSRGLTAAAFGDIDLRLIDGSAVWLTTISELLAAAGVSVTLLLKGPAPAGAPLYERVAAIPGVRVIEQVPRAADVGLRAAGRLERTVERLRSLDAAGRFDLIVVRGTMAAARFALEPSFAGRLWPYLTDFPQSVADLDDDALSDVERIVTASRTLLCQTEEIRSYLEGIAPASIGKTAILPPIAPPGGSVGQPRGPAADRPLRIVYSGKFAPMWKTLEMTALPGRLAEDGVSAELVAIGDKIHADLDDPTYQDRMEATLRSSPGVVWRGGMAREDAIAVVATADVALSWRDESLNASLELSTKVLEYGAVGVPVVLNRTPAHERLLGRDYPLFASTEEDVVDAINDVVDDPSRYALAVDRVRRAAQGHTFDRAKALLEAALDRVFPPPVLDGTRGRNLRIVVASHDLKFFTGILGHLRSLPDVEVRVDEWPGLDRHDVAQSTALSEWADVVICEWCGPNAVWYSRHKRTGQRLIVRLHRFELDRRWPSEVVIDAVDTVVAVSASYATFIRRVTGWPADKITVISNWVDDVALDRPKLAGSRFHLGFIGMAPARKRLDRALDILELLRAQDRRYRLFVKSKLVWDYPWFWARPAERDYMDLIVRRLRLSRLLTDAVTFDMFGPDVASWLRRIGFVLSTSDDESFHLAPAEGMASGAVPAILDWPGADTIYDRSWIHDSPESMTSLITSLGDEGWKARGDLAKAQARDRFGLATICAAWTDMIRRLVDPVPPEWSDRSPVGTR
jgi:glycosyltransferase involved in cell wall biosynthesis